MKQKRLFFLILWLLILVPGPITVLKITPIARLTFEDVPLLLNFLLRIAGLLAFSMLFVQLILGAFMTRFTQKLGGWAFKFHVTHGAFLYSLILAHPILFVLFNFKAKGVLDPFYVFTQFCVICSERQEIWYTFGRISFWLISMAVLAAILRKESWWRVHWRKFHLLNYVAFFLVAIHAWFSGTDVWVSPFVLVYWLSVGGVSATVIYKLYPFAKKYFRSSTS
ncbi:hypothetical protein IID21_03155 [Patescibacteria group bacterium]|nr:hypothetical protein [Patescibacteria group bacterium]